MSFSCPQELVSKIYGTTNFKRKRVKELFALPSVEELCMFTPVCVQDKAEQTMTTRQEKTSIAHKKSKVCI